MRQSSASAKRICLSPPSESAPERTTLQRVVTNAPRVVVFSSAAEFKKPFCGPGPLVWPNIGRTFTWINRIAGPLWLPMIVRSAKLFLASDQPQIPRTCAKRNHMCLARCRLRQDLVGLITHIASGGHFYGKYFAAVCVSPKRCGVSTVYKKYPNLPFETRGRYHP